MRIVEFEKNSQLSVKAMASVGGDKPLMTVVIVVMLFSVRNIKCSKNVTLYVKYSKRFHFAGDKESFLYHVPVLCIQVQVLCNFCVCLVRFMCFTHEE